MGHARTGDIWLTIQDGRPPTLPEAVVRDARRNLVFSLVFTALAAALAGDVLVTLANRSQPELVAVCLLAQLPVLVVVTVGCCSLGRRFRTPLASLAEVETRAEHAEEALAREHERMHELRATIAGVSASHRVLHDPRAQLTPRRRRRLQRMQTAELDRLERVLGDRSQPAGAVDLDAVIAPLVEASTLLGSPVSWTGAGCWVHGRRDGVAEAVHVLLENAARHAPGQGVELTVAQRGAEVDVTVSDHGPGVAPEVLPGIFERRVRGPHSSGDGLGLSIAQRLATGMGGGLRLAPPRPGRAGATFVLTLPADSGAPECLAAPS